MRNPISTIKSPCPLCSLWLKLFYKASGYTLLETVVSLVLLTAVVVPLITRFYRGNALMEAKREITATWLLEREAEVLRTFPHKMLPVKRHYIDDNEWTIRTEVAHKRPECYTLSAEFKGKVHASTLFYGRAEDEK